MPAPFAAQLCGFRDSRPNTSDKNDAMSIELGHAMFRQLGVEPDVPAPEGVGASMERLIVDDLAQRRPDLFIGRSLSASHFSQYEHLAAIAAARSRKSPTDAVDALAVIDQVVEALHGDPGKGWLVQRVQLVQGELAAGASLIDGLLDNLPTESMLNMDIVIAEAPPPSDLGIALSSKWTLRTDRAQDCISQGNKLVSLRRGRMPHFAAITMEPRPAMLRLLADGSGSVDCVYHLDLPALSNAIADLEKSRSGRHGATWSPRVTFDRLVRQRRLRDYDDLVREVGRVPRPEDPHSAERGQGHLDFSTAPAS